MYFVPKFAPAVALAAVVCAVAGCTTTPRQQWEWLKGPGFPGWSENLASSTRAGSQATQPSGFFTDRRSEQIEKDLGGF